MRTIEITFEFETDQLVDQVLEFARELETEAQVHLLKNETLRFLQLGNLA